MPWSVACRASIHGTRAPMSNNYDPKKQWDDATDRIGPRHQQIQKSERSDGYENLSILNQYSRNNLLHATMRAVSFRKSERLRMPIFGTHLDVVVPRR